jgi:hypothetical protein
MVVPPAGPSALSPGTVANRAIPTGNCLKAVAFPVDGSGLFGFQSGVGRATGAGNDATGGGSVLDGAGNVSPTAVDALDGARRATPAAVDIVDIVDAARVATDAAFDEE